MTSDIHGYLYASRAVRPADEDGGLYLPSRVKNRRLGVSGFLHRQDDTYFQYLEGPAETLAGLAAVIASDPRHRDFVELFNGPVAGRLSGSAMGYTNETDMDWRDWAATRRLPARMYDADPGEIIAFLGSYGDPEFAGSVQHFAGVRRGE